ncbi:MAG: hypothetical protein ACKPKO_60015, partial [Candidatus Fonsibacter sp.]
MDEYGEGDLFIDDEEPEWLTNWRKAKDEDVRKKKLNKTTTKQTPKRKQRVKEDLDRITEYIIDMMFCESTRIISESGEVSEQRRTRHVR